MGTASIVIIALAALLAMLTLYVVVIYNKLVQLKNRFKNAFAQIDVQLKRRYDLIPNLVEVAKAYLKHERETLEAVIKARNQAVGAVKRASASPDDPGAIAGLAGAEGVLSRALGRLFALVEAYPDLKADQNMRQLSEELTSTENKIAFARQAFNDSVMYYNTRREVFPSVIVANTFNFKPAMFLEIEEPGERKAPKVSVG